MALECGVRVWELGSGNLGIRLFCADATVIGADRVRLCADEFVVGADRVRLCADEFVIGADSM